MQITPEQAEALRIAREMAEAGIPVFIAPPDPSAPGTYFYPRGWQTAKADPSVLDGWRPGWGVGAVGGGAADFLDIDPRSGGETSEAELRAAGHWPRSFGRQRTPSGGTHDVLTASGERKVTALLPGVDFQAGGPVPDETGSYGRAFIWIAPTVGVSKVTRELVPYRWETAPDLAALSEWAGQDDSLDGLISRVHARRVRTGPQRSAPQVSDRSADNSGTVLADLLFGQKAGSEPFTMSDAEHFVGPAYDRLITAEIGQIEERGMDLTLALEHFVPAFWSVDEAYALILGGLAHTRYDPKGPSRWTADKFLARLDGRRPVAGSWKAVRAPERVSAEQAAAAFGHAENPMSLPVTAEQAQDAVQALLDRMLTADQLAALEPPEPLVEELLDRDTLATLIGLPGSFKSFVALDIAAHVGTGQSWRGRHVHQGEVVYIVAEGARGMTLRTRAWSVKNERPMTGVRFLPEPVQVKDPVAWQVLVEACRRIQPVMVVIDTQAMVTVGMEENSNTEMGVALSAFRRIREATGACVLLVHHTTKTGEGTRGAGAQDGAQDTRLKVVRQEPRSSLVVKLTNDKQKDMAEVDGGITFRLESVPLGSDPRNGRELSSLVPGADVNAYTLLGGQGDAPEPWEVGHGEAQIGLIKVLRDQGGSVGLTRAQARESLIERFYPAGGRKLARSTFASAWTKVMEKCSADGAPVVVNVGGERYAVDPVALANMTPEEH